MLAFARLVIGRGRREPDLLEPQPLVADDADLVQHLRTQLRRAAEKEAVGGRPPRDRHAHRARHMAVDGQQRFQRLADLSRQVSDGQAIGRVDRHGFPAQHVEIQTLDLRAALLDRHEHRAAAARLADMAPLQVAGKHHGGRPRPLLEFVHVAERPVVVAFRMEFGQRARRIVRVRRIAFERRMQHADVVVTGHRIRIADREIVNDGLVLEALPVQRDFEFRQLVGFRLAVAEYDDVVGQCQLLRHLAFGIVVAAEDERTDAGLAQAPHLLAKEDARVVILPVAVVQVAGNHEECDLLFDRTIHELPQRLARRVAQLRGRRVGIRAQAVQRAVKVYVCRVDELHEDSSVS